MMYVSIGSLTDIYLLITYPQLDSSVVIRHIGIKISCFFFWIYLEDQNHNRAHEFRNLQYSRLYHEVHQSGV